MQLRTPTRFTVVTMTGLTLLYLSTASMAQADRPVLRKTRPAPAVSPASARSTAIRVVKGPNPLAPAVKLQQLKKLGVGHFDIKKTFVLTPSHPVDGQSWLGFTSPTTVFCNAGSRGSAQFASQTSLMFGAANKMVFARFRPVVTGRYVVEVLVSGAKTIRAFGCGQETTHVNPANVLLVIDAVAGEDNELKIIGEASQESCGWHFHGCLFTAVE